jgi:hypothetical protein
MLTDPAEGRFLQALLGQTEGDEPLLDYAGALAGRDDLRSEFLRLECLLSAPGRLGEVTPERQARYQELLHLLGPFTTWLRVVRRNDRILNCGRASVQPLAVRFRYECPKQWETLAPTPEAGVRFCGACQRSVYFCDSAESVERRARSGDCIAVPCRVTASVHQEVTRYVTGTPDFHELWAERLFGG